MIRTSCSRAPDLTCLGSEYLAFRAPVWCADVCRNLHTLYMQPSDLLVLHTLRSSIPSLRTLVLCTEFWASRRPAPFPLLWDRNGPVSGDPHHLASVLHDATPNVQHLQVLTHLPFGFVMAGSFGTTALRELRIEVAHKSCCEVLYELCHGAGAQLHDVAIRIRLTADDEVVVGALLLLQTSLRGLSLVVDTGMMVDRMLAGIAPMTAISCLAIGCHDRSYRPRLFPNWDFAARLQQIHLPGWKLGPNCRTCGVFRDVTRFPALRVLNALRIDWGCHNRHPDSALQVCAAYSTSSYGHGQDIEVNLPFPSWSAWRKCREVEC